MNLCTLISLFCVCKTVVCIRDFYVGVFNKNDLLVAQDTLYRDKAFFSLATANYVRYFKCPISYFRVLDRLGVGRGPRVEIVRGGLQKNVLGLRFTSMFNTPINVNIYIACANLVKGKNVPIYTRPKWTRAPPTTASVSEGTEEGTTAASSSEAHTTAELHENEETTHTGEDHSTGNAEESTGTTEEATTTAA